MNHKIPSCVLGLALCTAATSFGWTAGSVPADGVYKFTFGVSETQDGSIPVPASAVCDVNGTYTDTFSYGFLGTTDDSYKNDVPSNLKGVPHAIDGFKVVKGQKIVLHDTNDVNSVSCVCGPAASEYLPAGASSFEGRYPVRFAARMPDRGYYAVTCTVANASATANADVTLFSERCHTHAQHLALAPGETKTFAWSVELAPNYFKNQGTYTDNAINVVVVGENAALASVTVVKQPTTSENAMVRGSSVESMNTGKTIWLCDDSTGTDQRCDTPYFALQNYAGVGSGLSRWAPADLSVRNQGEGGLASSDNAHLATCLLKPGDYLYVQYGHNEKGTDTLGATDVYTNNLEKYLTLATSSQAKLIVVSPVERRYTWDSTNNKWSRTLQSFATAGKAWVEDKIANGAKNVAFLDLNEYYSEWMNNELVRIHNVNSSVSLQDAIGFYYQCSKGGKVDSAHPNNAGADWGAYWVWKAAVDAVAAGADAEEGTSAKIQATVLAGITDGVAARLAADEPWLVSDVIVNAGKASNSYWDYAVKAGYDYINSAAVAAVDATVSEGVATISGVKMRVLNQLNYAKAVIDVVSADGTATNRWYSYCNYDASGNVSGDIVVPEEPGFLSADLDKDSATTSSTEYSATLTVPAGGKAYIWFAEASGNTWQVGENADSPISAKYPLEAWTSVLLDDDCSDISTWTTLFGGVNTFAVADGAISFSMTGYDGNNNKKNGGFAKAFADSASVSDGRVRVSFKTLYTQGALRFAFSNTDGSTTNPMSGGDVFATISSSASVFGAAANVTLSDAETPVAQSTINSDEWMDVDMIIDLDAGKATASVGGADYATFSIGTLSKTPWSYFGVTLASEKSHAGAIDDVKIVALAPTPQVTVAASANNAAFGSVAINGTVAAEATAFVGSDVALTAVSADADLYVFDHWEDVEGNNVSTKRALVIEAIAADCAYTAVFREYAHDENRIATWDFSDYALSEIAATGNQTVDCNGMSIFLQNGDTITGEGIYWANVTFNKDSSVGSASGRHIEWTPAASGTATIVFQVGSIDTAKNQKPYLRVVEGDADMAPYTYYATAGDMVANADQTLTFNVTAGTLYKIYSFYYNRSSSVSIKSVAYSYAPNYITAAAAVNNANFGSATANGAASANVFGGKNVTFVATPASSVYTFVNWTDGEENIVSTEATFTVPVSADVAYTANFEKVSDDTVFTASVNFAAMTGANAVSASSVTYVDIYPFRYYLASGDTITENGLYWGGTALKPWNGTVGETGRHIEWTAPADGTVEITFQTSQGFVKADTGPYLCVATNEQAMTYKSTAWASQVVGAANTDNVLRFSATAGTLYKIYSYFQNRETTVTITSITYPEVVSLVTLAVANADAAAGTVTVNGAAVTESIDVQKGEYVHLVAMPSGANAFAGWKNDSEEVVSTETDFWLCVEEATSLTATWRTVDTHAFTWNPSVASGNWNNSANWLYEGLVPASTYPSDSSQDVVTFDTEAAVNFPSAVEVSNIVLNANVAFSGQRLSLNNLDGEGVLTLNGMNIANNNDNTLKVNTDVAVAKGTTNTINIRSSNNWKGYINLNGNLSGEGIIDISIAGKSGVGITFAGDNRDFFGDINTTGGTSNRNPVKWDKPEASGTNIFWNLEHSFRNDKADGDMVNTSGTYRYGGYKGAWYKNNYADSYTLEIGSLDRNSSIDVETYAKAPNITKVGTADLALGTKTIKNLTVNGGSVTMPIGIAPNALTLAAGTEIRIAGDAAWEIGTETNLFSYTTLSGATVETLPSQVKVTGLANGLKAKISVEDNTVKATIKRCGFVISLQ